MIFLKSLTANGFKSYAENVEIVFDTPLTGIVGPNGAGKSNVVDALKWVLGERSMKQLRGKGADDVIFFGSRDKPPAKMAEVTLQFDNSNGHLHDKRKAISVTRRVYRGSGVSEYLINGEPATLKALTDIFLDVGLARGSLGIISQGTVSWFVETKPEERRKIFEEAAGIGRYAKKKEEAQSQLARTVENLKQSATIVNELARDLKRLAAQAQKAQEYTTALNELKELDLTLLARDYARAKEEREKAARAIATVEANYAKYEPETKEDEERLNAARTRLDAADNNVSALQAKLSTLQTDISRLEQRQAVLDAKLHSNLQTGDQKQKASALKQLVTNALHEVDQYTKAAAKTDAELSACLSEAATLSQKTQALRTTLNELVAARYRDEAALAALKDQQAQALEREVGVKIVLNNRAALKGVRGLFKDFLTVPEAYEKAIGVALGRAATNLITETSADAQRAIEFLRTNRAGLATFLPLEDLKPRVVRDEHREILAQTNGYLGTAQALIKYPADIDNAVGYLLGAILIATDLDAAFRISRFTYQLYRVITLEGDVVAAGGAITGGYRSGREATFNVDAKLSALTNALNECREQTSQTQATLDQLSLDATELEAQIAEKKAAKQRWQELIHNRHELVEQRKVEYEQLTNQTFDGRGVALDGQQIRAALATLNLQREQLNEDLRLNQESKTMYRAQVDALTAKLTSARGILDDDRTKLVEAKEGLVRSENALENIKNKINETYKTAIEFALQNYLRDLPMPEHQARLRVAKLQAKLESLGPINPEAIGELDVKQKRHDELAAQQQELITARTQIEAAIAEIDVRARADFSALIDALNVELPKTFYYLFGGGSCQIRYTNPDDVLTSGIEVYANPPGKNVGNLMLLSGGEKSLVALSVLFGILKISAFPLVILDEAESALDPANVERFASIIRQACDNTQFIVITHRQGTMTKCDRLLGATMQTKGVTKMLSVSLQQATNYASEEQNNPTAPGV